MKPEIKKYVCYCFEFTEEDIVKDLRENGRSTIMEYIAAQKRASGCNCAVKNPSGR
ncbi:hypothetical protein [Maridesulfovibrio sp. FT414]|uniref:hypothetical protein n=1 Tax=Maridesulfovibrio sp. FT414 TaxID=2979469 RepID=UPI003D8005CD